MCRRPQQRADAQRQGLGQRHACDAVQAAFGCVDCVMAGGAVLCCTVLALRANLVETVHTSL